MNGKPEGLRADQIVVSWGYIPDPLAKPTRGVVLRMDAVDDLDPGDLIRDLEELQRRGESSDEATASMFTLDQRYSRTSWGADAAVLEILMRSAEPVVYGLASAALWDGLKAIARKIDKRRRSERTGRPQQVEIDEVRNAVDAVGNLYDLEPGQLTAELVSRDTESAVVRVTSSSGDSFRTQIVWNDHGGVLTRIDPILDE
ncbi:hypothetical protein [Dietzia massiliensis]|uniref:hypothetical protein n=1 Tax=Dietzia massiliensis TaxID=2697499 RepID=UPI001BCB7407|nr:hypothetical protein [Dietzia massiliensis]MBS7548311.1 hypothetical protein [Dietzia massiliensis]